MSRRTTTLALLGILAGVAILYAPVLGHGYAFDDEFIASPTRPDGQANPRIATWPGWGHFFSTSYWEGIYPTSRLFRPLTSATFAAVESLFGPRAAAAQHAVNLALHLFATWLVYRLLRALACARVASLAGAAAFGAHALHSEVVASIVGRGDLLAFTGGLGGALLFLQARDRTSRLALAGLASLIGYCGKENALAFAAFGPLAGFAADRVRGFRLRRGPWLRAGALAFALPAAIYLLLRWRVMATLPPDPDAAAWFSTFRVGVVSWGFGLRQLALPTHLAADWGVAVFPADPNLGSPAALASWLTIGVLLGMLLVWRRHPRWSLCGAAALGLSFIASNIAVPIGVAYAERLYYPAAIATALAVAMLGKLVARQTPTVRRVALAALTLWIAWSAWLLIDRVPAWHSSAALFAHDYRTQPRSARIAINHAEQLRRAGDRDGAIEAFERTVELDPDRMAAWNELAVERTARGELEPALEALDHGLRARRTEGIERHQLVQNRALVLLRVDPSRAIAELDTLADRLGPAVGVPWIANYLGQVRTARPDARDDWECLLGRACLQRGDLPNTARYLEACRKTHGPLAPEVSFAWARLEANAGRKATARQRLQALAKRHPDWADRVADALSSLR